MEAKNDSLEVERMMADWMELTKGLNRSAMGITEGLSGLWRLSSGILLSLLSTHISVRSCGLLIMQGNGKVVELSLRESIQREVDSEGLPEANSDSIYAGNTIDVRYATELGEDIYNYIIEVFSGTAGIRKIFTMIPKNFQGNDLYGSKYSGITIMNEQCWLVPIRSSHTTLGLLRIMVEINPNK